MIAITVAAILLAGAAPAMASALKDFERQPLRAKFALALDPMPLPVSKLGRVVFAEETAPAVSEGAPAATTVATQVEVPEAPGVDDAAGTAALGTVSAMALAPIPVATAPAKAQATGSTAPSTRPAASATDELAQAKSILAGLIARYPILAGTTVTFGDTPGGYQAVAYYKSGRIIVNPNHTASLSTILNHEVWHIIDWRDNGVIDWGENVPPR